MEQTTITKAVAEGFAVLEQSVGVKKETGLNSDGSKKYEVVEVGKIKISIPTLAAIGLKDAVVKEIGEDGLPIYEDEKLDWAFGAFVAQCKVQARNKLVNGTAEVKEGQKIAENWEELVAESERKGNAEALKLAKETMTAFAAYMGTLGKKAETVAFAVNLFRNRDALATQPDATKAKFMAYLSGFVDGLTPEDATRYARPLSKVEEACKTAVSVEDF